MDRGDEIGSNNGRIFLKEIGHSEKTGTWEGGELEVNLWSDDALKKKSEMPCS